MFSAFKFTLYDFKGIETFSKFNEIFFAHIGSISLNCEYAIL
jgi:hypothetical protein